MSKNKIAMLAFDFSPILGQRYVGTKDVKVISFKDARALSKKRRTKRYKS